ncbi:uncharacterized protein LOC120840588 [Ixodes scapularis]|uniref:uncharacterized protein LOC120840588 n=1 Tax=Ixodes scapularis TaxID=6945 RepID=UPI001C395557|nr:uncharacterized protein LOC120840588 [Ixodes scapularis]
MPSGCYYGSYCCVAWCENNGKTHKKPGTKFFRIPRDARSKAWLDYAKRYDLFGKSASQLYATYRVCSDHFTAKDFMDPGQTTLVRSAVPTVRPPINGASAIGPTQATSSSGPFLQCSSVAASRAVLDQAEPDRLQNSPLPCSSAIMHSAVLDPSQATSSSGLFAGHCGPGQHSGPNHPAPVCRKLTKRPEGVIKRLQARISSYRKTIARQRKQQLKTPQTASQALEIFRPHVSEECSRYHLGVHYEGGSPMSK